MAKADETTLEDLNRVVSRDFACRLEQGETTAVACKVVEVDGEIVPAM